MRDRTTRTMDLAAMQAVGSPSPQRIRWGAVFAGVVLGMALLALLTTLWFALAFNSNVDTIRVNLEWYVGVTAVVALVFNVFNLGRVTAIADGTTLSSSGVDAALWASFWTILGGFVASGLGGLIGGAITMPANARLGPITAERTVDLTGDERGVDADHGLRDGRVVTTTHA